MEVVHGKHIPQAGWRLDGKIDPALRKRQAAAQGCSVRFPKETRVRSPADLTCFPLCHQGANGHHAMWDAYHWGRDYQAEVEPLMAADTQRQLIEKSWTDHRLRALLVKLGVVA
jgi:hypothetical protein